jgi:hypothetical protein
MTYENTYRDDTWINIIIIIIIIIQYCITECISFVCSGCTEHVLANEVVRNEQNSLWGVHLSLPPDLQPLCRGTIQGSLYVELVL